MPDKQILLEKMRHEKSMSLPILTFPAVQLLGINVRELVEKPEYQARAMHLLTERYPVFAALSMMDLSVEAEAFGAPVRHYDMDIPTVTGPLITSMEAAVALPVPDVKRNRTGKYVEGVRLAKTLIADKPVIAGVIGPFSLAGRLLDMTEIMVNCYLEPELVHTTLEKASIFIRDYILAFKEAGADGVLMAEPAAGLLSPETCEEFSSAYIRNLVAEVVDDDFLFIYHNCGNVIPLAESLIAINADAYHFGDHIDLEQMLKKMPVDKIVLGNISPTSQFRNGSPASMRAAVRELLVKCAKYPNFVISSGCDVPPGTPLPNIDAFFAAVADFLATRQ